MRFIACSPTLMTSGPALPPITGSKELGSGKPSLPCSLYLMADEEWDQISHNFPGIPAPPSRASALICYLGEWSTGLHMMRGWISSPTLMSQDQLLPPSVGNMGWEGRWLSLHHPHHHGSHSEASSPTLWFSEMAHLYPCQWGQFYCAAQVWYRTHSPKCCI